MLRSEYESVGEKVFPYQSSGRRRRLQIMLSRQNAIDSLRVVIFKF